MTRGLFDTSFVIALARGELGGLNDPPEEATISSVTLCGLHHGVLMADDDHRPGRLAVLAWAERSFAALPVDEVVAPHYGRIAAAVRRKEGRRPRLADALIAATAAAHGLTLYTHDRDFHRFDGVDVVTA